MATSADLVWPQRTTEISSALMARCRRRTRAPSARVEWRLFTGRILVGHFAASSCGSGLIGQRHLKHDASSPAEAESMGYPVRRAGLPADLAGSAPCHGHLLSFKAFSAWPSRYRRQPWMGWWYHALHEQLFVTAELVLISLAPWRRATSRNDWLRRGSRPSKRPVGLL